MSTFGERLRTARHAAGLTQEQLGFEVGVTKASVSAWENGRESPGFATLPRLGSALQVSLDALIAGTGGVKEPVMAAYQVQTPVESALLRRYRALDARRQRALLTLLDTDRPRKKAR